MRAVHLEQSLYLCRKATDNEVNICPDLIRISSVKKSFDLQKFSVSLAVVQNYSGTEETIFGTGGKYPYTSFLSLLVAYRLGMYFRKLWCLASMQRFFVQFNVLMFHIMIETSAQIAKQ